MTTIACDGESMSADSQSSYGDMVGGTIKIGRVLGAIVGYAGSDTEGRKFMDWFASREPSIYPAMVHTQALVLYEDGSLEYWDQAMYPRKTVAPFAIGSGAGYAMGAMLAGANSRRATEIACKLDSYSSGRVRTFHLKQRRPRKE